MEATQGIPAGATAVETGKPSPAQALFNTIKAWPLSRKIATAALLIITVGLFAYLILEARVADQQLLYANLREEDAASVVTFLKNKKIPYSLKNGGKNIWIAADKIYETRLELAANKLPQGGGIGYEIFDQQSFALTDYVQKVNHTRALQGELSRTISSLDPVETTRVHLALPEKRLFKDQQKKPTASVIVTLKANKSLDRNQVKGIVHLVAGSVPDLEPDNVKIIDSHGVELKSDENADKDSLISTDLLTYQHEVEQRLELRAQDLLDKTMGPDRAMVRVSATLDFSKNEKTQELFDAEEPVVRSEQITTESTGNATSGGVPGVQSNLQGTSGANQAQSSPPSSKSTKTTNYEISKTLSKTIAPVGTVTKLSVSVLVADKTEAKEKDKAPETVPRTAAELKEIENMVATALGIVAQRGDQISVISMPFVDKAALVAEQGGNAPRTLYEFIPLIKMAMIPLAGLLLYLLLLRPVIKTMRGEVKEHYKTVEEMEKEELAGTTSTNDDEAEEAPPVALDDEIVKIRRDVYQNQVPTAYIVKNWIQEG